MKWQALVVVVAAGLLVGADDPKKDAGKKSDKDLIQGTWNIEKADRDGNAASPDEIKGLQLIFKDDKYTLKTPGGGDLEGTFKLDPAKKPKQLEATLASGETLKGIYKIEKDTFTLCISVVPGGERPADFKGGAGIHLYVMKKAK
jgi:uncharacterized protein (TIGR03067 family)